MDGIRQYIISIVAAAILCAVLGTMVPGKGTAASLIKLVSGIFLSFVVIQPIKNIDLDDLPSVWDSFRADAAAAVEEGENLALEASSAIIKEQAEAYILDKASQMDLALTVEVTLDAQNVPASAVISGKISPQGKTRLQTLLEEDLGISKEDQLWTG